VIRPFGEAALLVEVDGPDAAQAIAESLRRDPLPSMVEAVPALDTVLVELDPLAVTAGVASATAQLAERLAGTRHGVAAGRRRTIPVVYGGTHGPDLEEVARLTGLPAGEVVALHTSTELRVLFSGFAPGFAYLGDLPSALRVPRLATPRTRTPAGSVAVAESMSGIYPAELPGGWRVIGRTPLTLFDPRRDPPAYLVPGDRIRFVAIEAADWERHAGAAADCLA
jgi:KipI family sensor histidine kinase inhibitor